MAIERKKASGLYGLGQKLSLVRSGVILNAPRKVVDSVLRKVVDLVLRKVVDWVESNQLSLMVIQLIVYFFINIAGIISTPSQQGVDNPPHHQHTASGLYNAQQIV